MMQLVNNIEAFVYDNNQMSFKDSIGYINISESKWDFIFNFVVQRTSYFYFLGERIEYFDRDLKEIQGSLSEKDISVDDSYEPIYFRLRPASVIVKRVLLDKL